MSTIAALTCFCNSNVTYRKIHCHKSYFQKVICNYTEQYSVHLEQVCLSVRRTMKNTEYIK